jgi:Putative membrane protein
MDVSLPQFIISILLFFVLFFGIAFIINMLLRMTWILSFVYPIIALLIIDDVKFIEYFTNTKSAFSSLWNNLVHLAIVDIVILSSGLLGTIAAGFTMKTLRKKGYRMF